MNCKVVPILVVITNFSSWWNQSEYDIAVIETQARRSVSVKVKQFSLQGARILNDWQGPQMVKYKNKLHPWKYIVVLPVARNPIKISAPNLTTLKPVHEGIRRVLLSQQRDRGSNSYSHQQPPQRATSYDREQQDGGSQRNDYRGGDSYRSSDYNSGSHGGYDGGGGGGDDYRQQRQQDNFYHNTGRY